jgi:hypothetical protein
MIIILILLFFSIPGATGSWDDFSNNLATDLAPIITLFGEQVTKQFLSESTSFLDNIIFAVVPLGLLSAVVSAVRVRGNSSQKAFIGRAQEAKGVAEAELCSSTSHSVCELWSKGGICRVFGRPRILEFVYHPEIGTKFYQEFNKGQNEKPTCGLQQPKQYFPGNKDWDEVDPFGRPIVRDDKSNGKSNDESNDESGEKKTFPPNPNLSLNIGIARLEPIWHWLAAIFGVSLQIGFFIFASWVTFIAKLKKGDQPVEVWSFCLAVVGTSLLLIGMFLCAYLVEQSTEERIFKKKVNYTPQTL